MTAVPAGPSCHAPSPTSRFGGFLLLSVLLHGLLLAGWLVMPGTDEREPPAITSPGALQLRLAGPAPVTPPLTATPQPHDATTKTPSRPAARPPRPEPSARTTPSPPLPTVSEALHETTASPAETATSTTDSTETAPLSPPAPAPGPTAAALAQQAEGQQVLQQLREALARHFHYPPLAVRRGWQGTVELGFEVDPQGRLNNIHIAQSSGHALLDRAALTALGRVRQLDRAGQHHHILIIPVIYRLEEG